MVTAPRLLSVTPNAGLAAFSGPQRSRVVNQTVVFDQAVQLDPNAMTLALHTNNVSFNGVPGPLLYVSDKQSSAIVPYAAAGQSSAVLMVVPPGNVDFLVLRWPRCGPYLEAS